MRTVALIAALALAACSPRVVYRDRIVQLSVPVAVDCATERPVRPVPLKDKTPQWGELDTRQKAALVAMQGLEWQTYGEGVHAATAACPQAGEP